MREKKRDFAVKEREITLINLKIDSVFLLLQSGMFTRFIRVIRVIIRAIRVDRVKQGRLLACG